MYQQTVNQQDSPPETNLSPLLLLHDLPVNDEHSLFLSGDVVTVVVGLELY